MDFVKKDTPMKAGRDFFLAVALTGAAWGIFEATVGYLLHLLPIKLGFLIWYPVACGFMALVYRRTGRREAVLYVGVLSAGIKLFNLLLPVRPDMVWNPAVSIVLESLTLYAAAAALAALGKNGQKPLAVTLAALGMNSAWRGLYLAYLLWLVPPWVREVSVLQTTAKLVRFIVTDNLASTAVLLAGWGLAVWLSRRRKPSPWRLPSWLRRFPVKLAAAALLLCASALLQMFL